MFLAHFSHTGIDVLLEMGCAELIDWHASAIRIHKHLNTPPEK